MSNETLSYLGYEDLSDFSSQHSDFANLLVTKEGYIYKFQNFSWIDFILYSGSPNKSALLQLKSGEPLEIKLSVKEVHLLNELGGNTKFYSIRILSDNFVNIAAKTDASITKQSPPKNAFNLNNLIDDTPPSQPVQTTTEETVREEPEARKEFVLNFPNTDSLDEEEKETVMLDFSKTEEETFVLSTEEETTQSSNSEFKLKLPDSPIEEKDIHEDSLKEESFSLNFLKETSTPVTKSHAHDVKEEIKLDFIKPVETHEVTTQEEDNASSFKLKHVHMEEEPKKSEEKEEKITLNFLKQEPFSDLQEETKKEDTKISIAEEVDETPKVVANLDFLNDTVSIEEEPTEALNNKKQIIAQIQNDIKEIDEVDEEFTTSAVEISQKPSYHHEDVDAYLFNKNEVKKEKKSFTKTLKSLFADTSTFPPSEDKDTECVEIFAQPEARLKNQKEESFLTKEMLNEHRFPTLAALGLEKEEEDDLISEFVTDTKSNIRLFKDFYKSGNGDQAEYALIKMQSSANILNLNDIIITLAKVKQSCTNGDSESIAQLTDKLEKQVATLESYLESETV